MSSKQDRPETTRKSNPDLAAPRKRFRIAKLDEQIALRAHYNLQGESGRQGHFAGV